MDNDNRKKIGYLLIFSVFILIIAILLVFLFPNKNIFQKIFNKNSYKTEEEKTSEQIFEELKAKKDAEIVYVFDKDFEDGREWVDDDFKQISRSFAERFGSYSNQSNYGNIDDLKVFMTAKMKSWADDYIQELMSKDNSQASFYGITTKALVEPRITKFDIQNGGVELIVATHREEFSFLNEKKIFNQDIKIVFVKEKGEWLVDSAFWQ